MGTGSDQARFGTVERAWACWAVLIRRARRPVGATNDAAVGRMASKRSTARRVTTWKVVERVSARAFCILTLVNVRARVTSRRKAAFLWLDSTRVREICGAQSFMGRPGNPAPEPTSARVGQSLVGHSLVDRRWSLTVPSGAKAPASFWLVTWPPRQARGRL